MSYTALYRKWRSRDFDEVKGQEAVTEAFKNQIISGRIGHAYLFCGTRGTGKTSVAKILSRAVNCESPINGNPCNSCPTCLSILRESSMNVVELDAASNNGVDDVRRIREQVTYPPVDAKYKVYIIDEVHMLSTSAFNAFLKTLEEPPDYVIFILATTEPGKIPITILSRCQRYDFKRISTDVIAGRLREISDAEKIDISDEALYYIARVGDGSMRDSVSLLDQCAAFLFNRRIEYEDALEALGAVDVGIFSDIVRAMAGRDIRTILKLIADVAEQGRELGQFVQDFLHYVRDMLMAKTTPDLTGLVDMSKENLKRLKEDCAALSLEELLRYVRALSELNNQLRYAPQKRISIETTFMKLSYPETDVTKEGLLARISDLERKLSDITQSIKSGIIRIDESGAVDAAGGAAKGELINGVLQGAPAHNSDIDSDSDKGAKIGNSGNSGNSGDGGKKSLAGKVPRKTAGGPEDIYQVVLRKWPEISRMIPAEQRLMREAIKKSEPVFDKENFGIGIATKDKVSYNILSASENLNTLKDIIAENIGNTGNTGNADNIDNTENADNQAGVKTGKIPVRILKPLISDGRRERYVTDEDLKQINFPIEITDDTDE